MRSGNFVQNHSGELAYLSFRPSPLPPTPPIEVAGELLGKLICAHKMLAQVSALAERVNGILKTEWIYVKSYPDRKACETDLVNIVAFYNNQRPHMSIGYKTPSVVHQEKGGPQQRYWTNPWNRQKEEKKEENQELNQKTVSILLGIDKKDVNGNRFKERYV